MALEFYLAYAIFTIIQFYVFYKLNKKRKRLEVKSTVLTFLLIIALIVSVEIFDLKVPFYAILLGMITIVIHNYFGYYKSLYERSRVFDRFLHVFGTFSFTVLVYFIVENLFETGGSEMFKTLFVFTEGTTLGILFELLEFSHDKRKGTFMQKGLRDTNVDMVCNMLGSVAAAIFSYIYIIPQM